MSGKRLTPADDAAILALHKSGKTYQQIVALTGHSNHTVWRVLHGRPQERRKPKNEEGPCVECGTTTSDQWFHRGGGIRCVTCAGKAVSRAMGRKV